MSIRVIAIHSFAAKNSQQITKNWYFGGSRSFKIIDIDTTKKHIICACFDKQLVCAYLQPFSR